MDWPITKRIAPSCRARRDISSGIKMSKPEVVRFRTFVHGPLDMMSCFGENLSNLVLKVLVAGPH